MYSLDSLKYALEDFYRAGIDCDGYTESEVDELLEDLDFPTLLQAIRYNACTVHGYMTQGGHAAAFNYRGSDLFGQQATRIYVDFDQNECTNGVLVGRSYELWMLEDMSIIAVACVSMSCNDGTYITEYREVKGDPRECDMCLDLVDLTDQLDDLCWAVYENKIPVFEL